MSAVVGVLALWLLCGATMAAAEMTEPRKITSAAALKPGEGAVAISMRHQTPVPYTMHVFFADVDSPDRVIKFERKVGLGGLRRMLARSVNVYAVPAGRWRMISHVGGCDTILSADMQCVQSAGAAQFPTVSATYPADWITVEVVAGGYTDADEIILEVPKPAASNAGVATPSISDVLKSFRFKHRAVPAREKAAFEAFLTLSPGAVLVADDAVSDITCEQPQNPPKMQFIPFEC